MAISTAESTRIRGKKLVFKIGANAFHVDASKVELSPADSDDTATFGSIQAGGSTMKLNVSGIQSTKKTSLWRWLFDNVGKTATFVFAPNGNETPTADEPHIVGTITVEKPPVLSTEVNSTSTFDLEIPVESWSVKETA